MARITSNGTAEVLTDPPSEYTSVYRGIQPQKGNTMIDKANPPKYLRQKDTGRIYVYRENLAGRADMEPYEMPVKEEAPGPPVETTAATLAVAVMAPAAPVNTPAPEGTPPAESASGSVVDDRKALIKGAISMILPEEFSKPAMGRPAMPKVAQVSQILGFKVSAEEILKAMEG